MMGGMMSGMMMGGHMMMREGMPGAP